MNVEKRYKGKWIVKIMQIHGKPIKGKFYVDGLRFKVKSKQGGVRDDKEKIHPEEYIPCRSCWSVPLLKGLRTQKPDNLPTKYGEIKSNKSREKGKIDILVEMVNWTEKRLVGKLVWGAFQEKRIFEYETILNGEIDS